MAELLVPISPGELIDKITILEIKSARMTDAAKLHNVRTELALLNETWRASPHSATDIRHDWTGLRDVNGQLWDIEDRIRDKERGEPVRRRVHRARARRVRDERRARGHQAPHQHQARVGPGGGEELQGIQEGRLRYVARDRHGSRCDESAPEPVSAHYIWRNRCR